MSRLQSAAGRIIVPLVLALGLAAVTATYIRSVAQTQAPDTERGRHLFREKCALCHGYEANGAGPGAVETIPPPANLTLIRDTPSMEYSIVHNGILGTSMRGHPSVTEADSVDIFAWLKTQPLRKSHQWDSPPANVQMSTPDMGATLYQTTCAGCHGPTGMGDGPWADDDPHVWPKPANFQSRNSEIGRVYHIINNGREGTFMAPQHAVLPTSARWALAQYVYSLYKPDSTGTIQIGQVEGYKNPHKISDKAAVDAGADIAALQCAYCHGAGLKGTFLAPRLVDEHWRFAFGTDNAVYVVILKGVPGQLMPPHQNVSSEITWDVVTYIRKNGGLPDPLAGGPQD